MQLSGLLPIFAFLAVLVTGCSDPSGKMGEVELPETFGKAQYLAKHFEHLDSYCELLDYLYAEPASDAHVVAEIERLVSSSLLLAQAISMDPAELNHDSVTALICVLDLAENEKLGDELGLPLVFDPSVEYLQSMRADLEARQEQLASQIEY